MTQKDNDKVFIYTGPISLKDFAKKQNINEIEIIKYFFLKGVVTNINTSLKENECKELCKQYKLSFKIEKKEEEKDFYEKYLDFSKEKNTVAKTPVVTIMGHVDHGKTTLLDKIRNSNIADREFANITQHIGAYQIKHKNSFITFLDTPGHEAFTKMRGMGGKVADIVILVVAADDGIQPQTVEAIQHALAAKVKIVIFVNKIDKGEGNLPSLKQQLMKYDILLEEFGGSIMLFTGSALKNQGIDSLLEGILLIAEMEKFQTTLDNPAVGIVIETKIEKGIGSTATVLLSRGKVKVGDFLVMSSSFCKIKNIIDDCGKSLKELIPGQPAKISGFKDLPVVGDKFMSFSEEKEAKKFYDEQATKKEEKLLDIATNQEKNKLNVIIRSDVSGTMEAIKHLIEKIEINIVAYGVGPITEADVHLAVISNSLIVNFNQKVPPNIESFSKTSKVLITTYKSIYQVEEALIEFKEKNRFIEKVEIILGKAKVVKLWHHSKVGTIAGCIVESGKINFKHKIKLVREEETLTKSTIKSFKTESFEIKEAKENQECGIVVADWNDVKVGDYIFAFDIVDKI